MRIDDHFGKLLASEKCSVQTMTYFVNKVGDDGLFQEEASADALKQYGLSFFHQQLHSSQEDAATV